jgi:hypothetical protein
MDQKRFFCLRGFMKSGTNWLGKLLSSHPQISCLGEFHWQEIIQRLHSDDLIPHGDPEIYRETVAQHLQPLIKQCMIAAADPDATVIGDRTPQTLAPITLPNAPHISIIRDGRDVLVSRAFHLYNNPQVHRLFQRIPEMRETLTRFQNDPWHFQEHPDQLLCHEIMVRESVQWWLKHFQSDEETIQANPDLLVKFVKYEELHRDVEGERDKLFAFLDVDPAAAGPLPDELKPGFSKERPTEFLRKGVVGDWENYFTDKTREWFIDVAGELLIKQGYVENNRW